MVKYSERYVIYIDHSDSNDSNDDHSDDPNDCLNNELFTNLQIYYCLLINLRCVTIDKNHMRDNETGLLFP